MSELTMSRHAVASGAYSQGRIAGLMEAAGIADAHKGSAARERKQSKPWLARDATPESWVEIQAEERGEDIAAEHIFSAIRALAEKETPNPLNPWRNLPKQYAGRWAYDYSEKNSEFFVHCGGHAILSCEDSEVAEAVCAVHNGRQPISEPPSLTPLERDLLGALRNLLEWFAGHRIGEDAEIFGAARAVVATAEQKDRRE